MLFRSGQDKISERQVVTIETNTNGNAVFKSNRPHGLGYNDFVQVTYSNSAEQAGATFSTAAYYAYPLTPYKFLLSRIGWTSATAIAVQASELPSSFLNSAESAKFLVSNIYPYYIPPTGQPYELSSYSHHRLAINGNASLQELNEFYIKVQQAFPQTFGYTVNRNIASAAEVEIVAPTAGTYPNNLPSNSTNETSPYQNMVNHRSDYGMANGDYDGNIVSGFKSVILNSSTAVILQKDPAAFELYADAAQTWVTLTSFAQKLLPTGTPITSVPVPLQLQSLNEASIPNIRYHYDTLKLSNGKSIGLANPDTDFRHFGFRLTGANSFMQAQSLYTIGAAIAVWAREGALISLTNATTNFGSVAFQADGFAGINSLGGANEINKGFLQSGVVRPLALTETQVTSDSQKEILSLGSKVVHVAPDPLNPEVQLI